MRKFSLFLAAVICSLTVFSANVFASDTDFTMSYDFNDYDASMSSGVLPSPEWSYFSGGNAFGSDGNGAMLLNWNAKPAVHLINPVKCVNPEDSMHISFRAKATGQLIVGTAKNNNNHDEDITGVNLSARARHNIFKITKKAVLWDKTAGDGGCTTYSWTRPDDGAEWHRYDMVRASNGSWTFFVNGVDVSSDVSSCTERAWGGYHGSAVSVVYFFENASKSTIDDVKIRVEKGNLSELSMAKIGEDRVERDKGVLNIALSEPVDTTGIVKENIKIWNNITDAVVTDFEVVSSEEFGICDEFTINFGENTLASGEYTVELSDSVKGLLTDTSVSENLVFKPAYKKTDGVVHPEAESVQFIGIDGENVTLSDNMNAGVKEIIIKFNTIIESENIESYVVLNDESGVVEDLEYDVVNDGENSILTIKITNLLKPYEEYSFVVNKGIPAAENNAVCSENDDKYSFKTAMPADGGKVFGVIRNEVVKEDNKYYFSIAKTTEDEVKLWALGAVYKIVTNDSGEEFEMLSECRCFPVILKAEDKGVFEYEATFDEALSDDMIVKVYLNEYPGLILSTF